MSRHKTLRLSSEDDQILRTLARKLKRDESTVLRLGIHTLSTNRAPTLLIGRASDPITVKEAAAELSACTEILRSLVHYVRVDLALYPQQPLAAEKKLVADRLADLLNKAQKVRATLKAVQRLATGTMDFDIDLTKQIAEAAVHGLPGLRKVDPVAAQAGEAFVRLAAIFGLVALPPELGGASSQALSETATATAARA